MATLMQQYFERFGDKACCFEDLKPYLTLEAENLVKWTSFLEAVPASFVSRHAIDNAATLTSIPPEYRFRTVSTCEFFQNPKI
jgi:N-acetyltransferase B complex (NatB) non catalytic subunit